MDSVRACKNRPHDFFSFLHECVMGVIRKDGGVSRETFDGDDGDSD